MKFNPFRKTEKQNLEEAEKAKQEADRALERARKIVDDAARTSAHLKKLNDGNNFANSYITSMIEEDFLDEYLNIKKVKKNGNI